MTPRCNQRCNQPLIPHSAHLFIADQQFPLRVERDGAYVFMPDGTSLWRARPDAIQALKMDVRLYLERMEGIRQREAAEDRVDAMVTGNA